MSTPTTLLAANRCPLCDTPVRDDAPQDAIDTALAIHIDLTHKPSEILGLLRIGRETLLRKQQTQVGLDDNDPNLHWID